MQKGNKSGILIAIIIILIFIGVFGSCDRIDHNDGKCDICGKPATYKGNDEEYCEEHFKDVLHWYAEQ